MIYYKVGQPLLQCGNYDKVGQYTFLKLEQMESHII